MMAVFRGEDIEADRILLQLMLYELIPCRVRL